MTKRDPLTWDRLPLFATERDLGEAVLGWERRDEFKALAILHERHGMPKVDLVWGGRYVPGVKRYFDVSYGLADARALPLAPNGMEGNFHEAKRQAKGTRPQMAQPTTRPTGPVLVR